MALDPEVPQVPTGVDLNETPIIPCFEPGIGLGGVGDILPPVLSTPLDASSFPIFSGTSLNPGIEWPKILNTTYKEPKKGAKGKQGATDIPSWARGERPFVGESGSQFAKRLLDQKYGSGNYPTGPGSEYNKLKKYADRHFE